MDKGAETLSSPHGERAMHLRRANCLLPLALLLAAAGVVAGVSLPIMHVRWLFLLDRPVSILGGIAGLAKGGDYAAAALLLAFSVVFPLLKIAGLLACWLALLRGRHPPPWLLALPRLAGRWSMLDVLVVALIVFAIRAQPLADAEIAAAVLPFVAAVALIELARRAVERRLAMAQNR
jgi:paraquat-inducible protein A